MRTFVFILIVLAINFPVLAQEFSDDNPPTYGGIQTPGSVSFSTAFSFGSAQNSFFINSLVLDGNSKDYLLPEIDIEVGIMDRLSLELIVAYRKIVSNASLSLNSMNKNLKASKTSDGLNSVMLGANIGLLEEINSLPGIYLENQFFIPKSGYSNFQNEQLAYYSNLNFESNLSDVTSLNYSAGIGWDGNTPYPAFTLSFNPNFLISDKFLLYSNFYAVYAKYYNPAHFLDIGSTYYLNDHFSIDAYIGSELLLKGLAKNAYGALTLTLEFSVF